MELLRSKELRGTFKAKRFSLKGKCVNKKKVVSFSVIAQKITKSEEERVNNHESTRLEQTHNKKLASTFIEDPEVKKTLSNWKQMKRQRESGGEVDQPKQIKIQRESEGEIDQLEQIKIQRERDVARLKLEQIKLEQIRNTNRFSENEDSMYDFHKLIRCSFTYY
ncbi:unnamed protein product [Trifolium pratense]|uniref:Uncharacterized protein n=1 Tax=Trifolium pratense TaxID=57577 RepID=A0ACB0LM15_TRIPR|nr:unnamed protein product [Trifolium pratense]